MKELKDTTEVLIRFNEADPLGIVWHGHYIRYFEDGREAFGKKYGIGYLDFFKENVVVPIVHAECNYKKSLKFGDSVVVETIYEPCEAAKINFRFNLYKASDRTLVATGRTTQVFLDKDTQTLLLNNPAFFEEWKQKFVK
ncbi:acyl-CoA thioesterase [Niabella drilacis]|uniref:Acyl-CoA thioester hydrolase n=1 Tax=Niabella drilacis (strain DSM 25811 / CCM 8410 / CCUG 62505 / LMG 26954 / E90) TaxID=1285928 RepID=A0A1G6Q5V5_NIADE|nr:acyl-CoA thioesterase [Niabella drilacis]SDC87842.1 acyl-CoA thioester hydrolase [Niabella drilacis]